MRLYWAPFYSVRSCRPSDCNVAWKHFLRQSRRRLHLRARCCHAPAVHKATIQRYGSAIWRTYILCSSLMLRLGIRSPQLGFCITINSVRSWTKPFYYFSLNMEWTQNATIRSSIGAPQIMLSMASNTRELIWNWRHCMHMLTRIIVDML